MRKQKGHFRPIFRIFGHEGKDRKKILQQIFYLRKSTYLTHISTFLYLTNIIIQFNLYFNTIKYNIHLHQNILKKITIQDRHEIGEIAKGHIGLKWLSPKKKIEKERTCPKIIKMNQELYLDIRLDLN